MYSRKTKSGTGLLPSQVAQYYEDCLEEICSPIVDMKLLPQGGGVAPLAGQSKVVASEAATLIQLRLESMTAVDERIYRVVASWSLVVTSLARISLVTYRAVQAIHSRHSAVEVIAPSDRMRFGAHDRMTLIAIA